VLQAFHLELQYAAMKQKQQHEQETEDKNAVGEGSSVTVRSDKEAQQLSGQMDGQHQETGKVSDQVSDRVERTVSGHKGIIKGVYKRE
jgi:hypothetical protein